MVKKKTSGLRKCIARDCGGKINRSQTKYAKQYCETCYQTMQQLRRVRQPCRIIGCKNPAHEDSYCDSCRPYESTDVPFSDEWLRGENLIESNQPVCLYTRKRPEGNSHRISSIDKEIKRIREFLAN